MSKTLFLQPHWIGTGLTNQIFFIIYGIIQCINTQQKNLIIDYFRTDALFLYCCFKPISQILDLAELNTQLAKYHLQVHDRYKLTFQIKQITYGSTDHTIDITQNILSTYYTDQRLCIPANIPLDQIAGDPIIGQTKQLTIQYQIGDNLTTETYPEYRNKDIVLDLKNAIKVLSWRKVDDCYLTNLKLFEQLLSIIPFHQRFQSHCQLIAPNGDQIPIEKLPNKLNVIHLRVEKDMTRQMLKPNRLNQGEYDLALTNKYIELIRNHFNQQDPILILTYDLNNRVVDYLRDNQYHYYYTPKTGLDGREEYAIVDLLIGEKCNQVFIGNWNFANRQGATYSYALYTRNQASINIFIDLYRISEPEIIKPNIQIEQQEPTLAEFVDSTRTDKNSVHSYLNLYHGLFRHLKYKARNILEIGIGDGNGIGIGNGGSIKLWADFFIQADIYAVDIQPMDSIWTEIQNQPQIKLFPETNAYDEHFVQQLKCKFDIILDDGSHLFADLCKFIQLYLPLLTDQGILIIEDIQQIEWMDQLIQLVPNEFKKHIQIFDLRHLKGRYDDMVFVINKNHIGNFS